MNNIPTMTKNLLIVNFLAFVATWVLDLRGIDLTSLLGLHFFMAQDFRVYQFITYMFLHGGFTHIFFNICSCMADSPTYSSICSPCGCLVP